MPQVGRQVPPSSCTSISGTLGYLPLSPKRAPQWLTDHHANPIEAASAVLLRRMGEGRHSAWWNSRSALRPDCEKFMMLHKQWQMLACELYAHKVY